MLGPSSKKLPVELEPFCMLVLLAVLSVVFGRFAKKTRSPTTITKTIPKIVKRIVLFFLFVFIGIF